ncbi:hypothetical protein BGX38DRAFT_557096 [Terfezia claveryi]|nr:hypothetical protein BGX38DRAFT_557096 [Terfezia claveryi]
MPRLVYTYAISILVTPSLCSAELYVWCLAPALGEAIRWGHNINGSSHLGESPFRIRIRGISCSGLGSLPYEIAEAFNKTALSRELPLVAREWQIEMAAEC